MNLLIKFIYGLMFIDCRMAEAAWFWLELEVGAAGNISLNLLEHVPILQDKLVDVNNDFRQCRSNL